MWVLRISHFGDQLPPRDDLCLRLRRRFNWISGGSCGDTTVSYLRCSPCQMRVLVFSLVMLACHLAAEAQVRVTFIRVGPKTIALQAQQQVESANSTPAVPPSDVLPRRGLYSVYLPAVASGLDLGSTIQLLRNGGRETNPVLGSSIARITVTKVALTSVLVYALHRAEPRHPKATRIIGLAATAAFSAAALNNFRALNAR
jgi:hypothetical protein